MALKMASLPFLDNFQAVLQNRRIGPHALGKDQHLLQGALQKGRVAAQHAAAQQAFLPVVLQVQFGGGYIKFFVQACQNGLDPRAFVFE